MYFEISVRAYLFGVKKPYIFQKKNNVQKRCFLRSNNGTINEHNVFFIQMKIFFLDNPFFQTAQAFVASLVKLILGASVTVSDTSVMVATVVLLLGFAYLLVRHLLTSLCIVVVALLCIAEVRAKLQTFWSGLNTTQSLNDKNV